MRQLLAFVLVAFTFISFSQELNNKQKEIQVLETTEIKERKVSVGVVGGVVKYFGEESTDLTFDYGLLLKNHINNKFDLDYNIHFGETKYDIASLDSKESISYYGANTVFNINLAETIKKKDSYVKFSPYIGAGFGLLSSRPLNLTKKYVFFYIPLSVGLNVNVSNRFVVGLSATGRVLLSDDWDNNKITASKDFLFNPALSLKYVIGRKKKIVRKYVNRIISYIDDSRNNNTNYEKYEENEIEGLVEFSTKDIIDSTTTSNWKVEKPKNYLFYTIQVASFKSSEHNIDELTGVKTDFKFYDSENKRYNYCKGFYSSTREAQNDLKRIKIKNPDAFVTAIYENKRIKVYFAKMMINNNETRIDLESAKDAYLK